MDKAKHFIGHLADLIYMAFPFKFLFKMSDQDSSG